MPIDPLELTASLLGLASVWLVVRRNILGFPIGLVMVLMYAWIFFQAKLYSDVLLQIFFAVMQIHGWITWKSARHDAEDKIEIRTFSKNQWWLTGGFLLAGFLVLGYVMDNFTDAAAPFPDAYVAILSVLAQLFMNYRYLENWILWMGVNQVGMFLYASKQLYFTAVLYAVFLVMSVIGFLEWKEKYRTMNYER